MFFCLFCLAALYVFLLKPEQIEFLVRGVVNVNPGDNTDKLRAAHDKYCHEIEVSCSEALEQSEENIEEQPIEEIKLGVVTLISRHLSVLEAMKLSPKYENMI